MNTYEESLDNISGDSIRLTPDHLERKSHFFAKSLLVPETEPLSEEAMTTYWQHVIEASEALRGLWVSTFRLMGGHGSQVPQKDDSWSAVSHRDALWIVQHDGATNEPDSEEIVKFVESSTKVLQDASKGARWKSFPSFLDPSFSREQAHKQYFSEVTLNRLSAFKKKWDPQNIFSNPHSV